MKKFPSQTIVTLSLVLTIFIACLSSTAQEIKDGEGIKHEVQPKETFYSLSKRYGISISEIKMANPGVDYPKVGTILIIPADQTGQDVSGTKFIIFTTQEDVSIYILARMLRYPFYSLLHWNRGIPSFLPSGMDIKTRPADPETGTIIHRVADERSSLRDIADLYGVAYKILKQFNPQIRNRVWQGQKVSVPILEQGSPSFEKIEVSGEIPFDILEKEVDETWMIDCSRDPVNLDREYKIALMVPFSLEEVSKIEPDLNGAPSSIMEIPSFRFIQFYQGFLLAADTLSRKGLKLDLNVYDVDQDFSKVINVLNQPEMKNMDLIVGPFYKSTFQVAADFAQRNDIAIVNPLSAREDILVGNPNVFKVVPSMKDEINILSELISYRFYDHNFILVRENKYQGTEYVDSVKSILKDILDKDVPEVDYMTDSIAGIQQYLSDTIPNLIIIYAEREVLPVEILPLIYELNKDMEIRVIGVPEWDKFEQLEYKYLIELGAYIFSSRFIDYNEQRIKDFISDYRITYHSEPLDYAYSGYDIAYFFLSLMMDHGKDFTRCLYLADYPLLQTHFRFEKEQEGGFENTYWNVYYFNEYSLILIPGFR